MTSFLLSIVIFVRMLQREVVEVFINVEVWITCFFFYFFPIVAPAIKLSTCWLRAPAPVFAILSDTGNDSIFPANEQPISNCKIMFLESSNNFVHFCTSFIAKCLCNNSVKLISSKGEIFGFLLRTENNIYFLINWGQRNILAVFHAVR